MIFHKFAGLPITVSRPLFQDKKVQPSVSRSSELHLQNYQHEDPITSCVMQVFDGGYFRHDPVPFYSLVREIYPEVGIDLLEHG